jgi:hypothetical protein
MVWLELFEVKELSSFFLIQLDVLEVYLW